MEVWNVPTPSSPAPKLPPIDTTGDVTDGFCASFYSRLQNRRWTGFQNFKNNKAFVVSDAVPAGKLWMLISLSAYHIFVTTRTIHFFAIPPGDADNLVNVTSDVASPFFLGTINNPPLRSGVLLSLGGGAALEMQSASSSSVNGLNSTFALPERWKILACIDSGEVASTPSADGITLDAALIEVDSSECIPDFL